MRTDEIIDILDHNRPELEGRNPAGMAVSQDLNLHPHADSCLPPPSRNHQSGGTVLHELENIVRMQIETDCQGIGSVKSKISLRCTLSTNQTK